MIYIAHRLFALHDRALAAQLARYLATKYPAKPLFLPYCDTNEDTIQVQKKGFYLFERDVERLRGLAVLVAVLHGPSYDDGVCMELGFAYADRVPLVLLSTDFLSYSLGPDGQIIPFSDPLFEVLGASIVRVTTPYPSSGVSRSAKYYEFYIRNVRPLRDAFELVAQRVYEAMNRTHPRIVVPGSSQKQVYIEPPPYCDHNHFEEIKIKIEEMGWNVYTATRFRPQGMTPVQAASQDLDNAMCSRLLLLDGNGPETPPGAAFMTGVGLALGRKSVLYYSGSLTTHAHGREENARNLMVLYGCTQIARTVEELERLVISILYTDG